MEVCAPPSAVRGEALGARAPAGGGGAGGGLGVPAASWGQRSGPVQCGAVRWHRRCRGAEDCGARAADAARRGSCRVESGRGSRGSGVGDGVRLGAGPLGLRTGGRGASGRGVPRSAVAEGGRAPAGRRGGVCAGSAGGPQAGCSAGAGDVDSGCPQ